MKEEKLRVIFYGLGTMMWALLGSGLVKHLAQKRDVEIVGAVADREEKIGEDLGEVMGLERKLGVIVSNDIDVVLSETVADVLLDISHSFTKEVYPYVAKALKAKVNVVSIAEELAYPWVHAPELAISIDKLAKQNGVTVLATGINPGFAMDVLPIFLSGGCLNLKRVRVRRVVDIAGWVGNGTNVVRQQGFGMTSEEFKKKWQEGVIKGHVGLSESVAMVADALAWEAKIEESKEPELLFSKVRRDFSPHLVIEPGQLYRTRIWGRAVKDGEEVIGMELIVGLGFDLKTDGIEAGTTCQLEAESNIGVTISGISTAIDNLNLYAARVINAIPYVVNAKPGLLCVNEVGLISYWS